MSKKCKEKSETYKFKMVKIMSQSKILIVDDDASKR